jgi:tRNA isopentenyl-2-thiomethyl-A-37 hydroxylase MiaE
MRQSLSTALLALVIGHSSLSATAQVAPDLFAPARQHLLHQEYAAASASYRQGLRWRTGTPRDYYQAAQAAARNKEPKRALDWLAQAVTNGYYSEAQLRAEEAFAALAA